MTATEFRKLLDTHDWYYMQSDAPAAFRKGLFEAKAISRILGEQPELQAIYDEFTATLPPAALAGGAEAADSLFHAGFEAMRAYHDDGPAPDP